MGRSSLMEAGLETFRLQKILVFHSADSDRSAKKAKRQKKRAPIETRLLQYYLQNFITVAFNPLALSA